jgi:hypothetical protein
MGATVVLVVVRVVVVAAITVVPVGVVTTCKGGQTLVGDSGWALTSVADVPMTVAAVALLALALALLPVLLVDEAAMALWETSLAPVEAAAVAQGPAVVKLPLSVMKWASSPVIEGLYY